MRKLLSLLIMVFFATMANAKLNNNNKNIFKIYVGSGNYEYKEPGLMSLTGKKSSVGFEFHSKILRNDYSNSFFIGRVNYAKGSVKYTGSAYRSVNGKIVQSGLTDYINGDHYYDTAGLFASVYEGMRSNIALIAAWGIGFRSLTNNAEEMKGGYQRLQNYIYIPVNLKVKFDLSPNLSITPDLEYDYLLLGKNTSKLSSVGCQDIRFKQSKGLGYRASLDLSYRNFSIVPYYNIWNIKDSNTVKSYCSAGTFAGRTISFIEPKNKTEEYGLRLMFTF